MMRPRPWHDKARELLAEGKTNEVVAEACGVSYVTILRFVNPGYRKRQAEGVNVRQTHLRATEPGYRERYLIQKRRAGKLWRLRRDAKCEAYDTGRRYEDVCASWNITP